MRTFLYIDGFNFYYGAVRGTPYNWLDFKGLFTKLLDPAHQILSIKYFTAIVTGKLDPDQPIRQKTFIRALRKHIPELSVYYGQFKSHNKMRPLAYPVDKKVFGKKIQFANIIHTEEKGSDVNLATHMVNDAWLDLYDCAIVVSNDSDLVEPLRVVKERLKKKVGLVIPWKLHPSTDLLPYANFVKRVRRGLLSKSQLPDPIPGTTIRKPATW